jgi:EAL domain-containing protein (putative c-di-GMP-specific phosphodiesterase class I)
MNHTATRLIKLENELHHALQRQEFKLYYQVQWPTHTGIPFGVEALIRWQHPTLGLLAPAEFIDVLESASFMPEVGYWIIEEVCRQWRSWHDKYHHSPVIAINLAASQLGDRHFTTQLKACLKSYNVPAENIEIELTESLLMNDLEKGRAFLSELQRLGCSTALDDFGTGHSSLAYLARLPFNRLKIDRSFVKDIPIDKTQMELAKTISLLGNSLGLDVVAEGVETEEQANFLRNIGVDWLQGYLLARPEIAENIPELINKGNVWLKRRFNDYQK